MVLERLTLMRPWTLLVIALFWSGCLKDSPPRRLQQETPIAVAIVHDFGNELADVPGALTSEIGDVLSERNLISRQVDRGSFEADFVRKRASKARFQSISALAQGAPLALLVETRAQYYSQLNGRYRWTVYVKMTVAKSGDAAAATATSFTVPVMLSFDHHREVEALAYAAGPIATKIGKVVDDFVAGLDMTTIESSPTSASLAAPGTVGPMYFVMLDRFHNGNAGNDESTDLSDPQAFHGGDIAGLTQKLDHIAAMGFKTIWLSPIFSMRTEKIGEHGAFHGYWTEDLREIEARFGTTEELATLRTELERRGMNLVLDMVLNHVGYDTKMVTEHPDWFHHNGDIKKWDDPVQMTTFDVHGLPDLAQEKPPVYDFLLSASAHWIEILQPAGFRLDAVKHVGSDFWKRYTKEVREQAGPGFATIGELYNGDPKVIAEGFAEGGFSHLFDFPLYFSMKDTFCQGEHLGRLAATLSLDRLYADANRLVTFADNHDVPRVWSACDGNVGRVRALLTFLLTARGIPTVSYGTEIGLAGKGEPENRADMVFEREAVLAPLIRDLLTARREHEVFRTGVNLPLHLSAQHFAYLRVGDDEIALIAVNMGEQTWQVKADVLQSASGVSLQTGVPVSSGPAVSANSVQVVLYPKSELSLAADNSTSETLRMSANADAEELFIVGAGPELGAWDPEKALAGTRNAAGAFEFSLDVAGDAVGVFKFVRRRGGAFQWEDGGNRYLFAKGMGPGPLTPTFSAGSK